MTPSPSSTKSRLNDAFESVVALLLDKTEASRTTLRIDLPDIGASVSLPVAEALRPGERSLRHEGSVNQRAAATAQWLERHRRTLVQNEFREEPRPPQALIDAYGTKAQMLGPVILNGALAGWISVHENSGPRAWRDSDVAALEEAVDAVARLVEDFERSAGSSEPATV